MHFVETARIQWVNRKYAYTYITYMYVCCYVSTHNVMPTIETLGGY